MLARHAGFEQVGLFGVAFATAQIIMLIPSSLSIPAVSFMSETYASSRHEKFSNLVGTNIRLIWALTLPIAFGCAIFAPWIVRLFFGAAYREAAILASMMSFVSIVIAVGSIAGNAVAGSGRMWHALWINGFWVVTFVSSGVFLVPAWGAKGLAITFAVSYLLLAAFLSLYSAVVLRVRFEELKTLTILTTACVLGAILLIKSLTATSFCLVAVFAQLALIGTEWRIVLSPSERARLTTLVTQLISPRPA